MRILLVATGNQGKAREIQALLRDLPLLLKRPEDLGLQIEVMEDGQTYAENAGKKARAFADASGMLTLADDSGLEVVALEGAPGLFSARYAPQPAATDADRRKRLLQMLAGHSRPWTAQFCCSVALAVPNGEIYFAEGSCQGEIIPEERGTHGFGYDPIFYIPSMGKSMAELEMEEKNRLSHRARAIHAIHPRLLSLL